ncbi:MAG TPA: uracil-DNA glycosylase [Candidatus Paceibacterota bacterium]|nr:uracil-DNA glycosylase [Candidatus Paceibacterota bacterium]
MFSYLSQEWKEFLGEEVLKKTEMDLSDFLDGEYRKGEVYPPREQLFTALNLCPPKSVKVVILGQDPYHGEGEAHGLAFSVQKGVKQPPSLRNILSEVSSDLSLKTPQTGDLTPWAGQGVLLLNTVLSVVKDKANSHAKKGWEDFTLTIIRKLSAQNNPAVFMLWGKPAGQYAQYIDPIKHLILTAPHPSPLSSYRGFFGSKHFSKANIWLREKGRGEIEWLQE